MRTLICGLAALTLTQLTGCAQENKPSPTGDDEATASWSLTPPGSIFESRTTTHVMAANGADGVTVTRHTLLSKTGTDAQLKLEIASDGRPADSTIVRVPLDGTAVAPDCPEIATVTARETCTVPAGTFDCTRKTVTYVQNGVTRTTSTWTAGGIPVPVKFTVQNENLVSTTELTRMSAP
jgi:hypothetical protein